MVKLPQIFDALARCSTTAQAKAVLRPHVEALAIPHAEWIVELELARWLTAHVPLEHPVHAKVHGLLSTTPDLDFVSGYCIDDRTRPLRLRTNDEWHREQDARRKRDKGE